MGLKLKILIDNNTYIDHYYYGEPAFCCHLETGGQRILFDAGYSAMFMDNAAQDGLDLSQVSAVVISHGHNDHTGGLGPFLEKFGRPDLRLIAHPQAFKPKTLEGLDIGSPLSGEELSRRAALILTKDPLEIAPNLYFLGEIPLQHDFETQSPIGQLIDGGGAQDDYIIEDSALAYKGQNGLYVITGCSHRGICNIIEQAKEVCGDKRVLGVIGGFHLFKNDRRVEKTVEYFLASGIKELYPCHCVSFEVKAAINQVLKVNEVGVGLEIIWE